MCDLSPPFARVVVNDERYISEAHLVNSLAHLYRTQEGRNALVVAKLCDEWIDPSGRLLGLVRKAATGV